MKIRTDFAIRTGSSHEENSIPCEDTCLAGPLPNGDAHFVVVSDGCSNGGQTHLGSITIARMLVKAIFNKYMRLQKDIKEAALQPVEATTTPQPKRSSIMKFLGFGNGSATDTESAKTVPLKWFRQPLQIAVSQLVDSAAKALSLVPKDLAATMSYGIFSKEEGFIRIIGDGMFGVRLRDGTVNLYKYEWIQDDDKATAGGAYYPYLYRGENAAEFTNEYGNKGAYSNRCFVGRFYTNRKTDLAAESPQTLGVDLIDAEIAKKRDEISNLKAMIAHNERKMPILSSYEPKRPVLPESLKHLPEAPVPPAPFKDKGPKEFYIFRKIREYRYSNKVKEYERRKRHYEAYISRRAKRGNPYNDEQLKYDKALESYERKLHDHLEEVKCWEKKCQPYHDKIASLKSEIDYLLTSTDKGKEGMNYWEETKKAYIEKVTEYYDNTSVGSGRKDFEISEYYSMGSGMLGATVLFDKKDIDEIECIALFSDGIAQLSALSWIDAGKKMLEYTAADLATHDEKPKINGIARRKLSSIINRNCVPIDDLSVAVIHFGLPQTLTTHYS